MVANGGGDTLSPQRVEGILQLEPEIEQAMVMGDKQPYLIALIVPNADYAREWAKAQGKDGSFPGLVTDPDFKRHMDDVVEKVNKSLGAAERVRRFALTAEPFTIDNRMLTPSMKIRRHVIGEAYEAQLAALRR